MLHPIEHTLQGFPPEVQGNRGRGEGTKLPGEMDQRMEAFAVGKDIGIAASMHVPMHVCSACQRANASYSFTHVSDRPWLLFPPMWLLARWLLGSPGQRWCMWPAMLALFLSLALCWCRFCWHVSLCCSPAAPSDRPRRRPATPSEAKSSNGEH